MTAPTHGRRFPPPWSVEDLATLRGQAVADRSKRRSRQMFLPEGVWMARMKKEEARITTLSEYDTWAKENPDDAIIMGGFLFFRHLQNERSDLLDFRAGDKWQVVHGWLRDRVKD